MPQTKKIIATNKDKKGNTYPENHKLIEAGECKFPFIYKGKHQSSCVEDSNIN